jgi:hypothetical protein
VINHNGTPQSNRKRGRLRNGFLDGVEEVLKTMNIINLSIQASNPRTGEGIKQTSLINELETN